MSLKTDWNAGFIALFGGHAADFSQQDAIRLIKEVVESYTIAVVRNDGPEGGYLGHALEYTAIVAFGRDIPKCRAATKAVLLSILYRECKQGKKLKQPMDFDCEPGEFDDALLESWEPRESPERPSNSAEMEPPSNADSPGIVVATAKGKMLSVRVDETLQRRLEVKAGHLGQPVSKVAREIIRQGLQDA